LPAESLDYAHSAQLNPGVFGEAVASAPGVKDWRRVRFVSGLEQHLGPDDVALALRHGESATVDEVCLDKQLLRLAYRLDHRLKLGLEVVGLIDHIVDAR